jgi:uncharacterized protein (DUF1330 family)
MVSYDIVDMEAFAKYPPRVMAILPKYGGEILASDIEAISIEGTARTMNAILKFPSKEAALNCYNDPEYQREIKQIRIHSTDNCTMVLVKQFIKP